MKLNTRTFRYLSADDWRVLTAVEVGSKNHEVVPTPLITQLSGLHTGSNGVQKCISTLAKADLVARVRNSKYDGYRLTYGGLDYLALRAQTKSNAILHLGSQMGVGKESDIYLVMSPTSTAHARSNISTNETPTAHLTPATNPVATIASDQEQPSSASKSVQSILKIHRLGRTSFRSLARNRDYHRHRQHCSWQYLSRLSAQKEYAAMRALHDAGFPVPRPIAHNRHTIVMSLVPGVPLKDVALSAFETEAAAEASTEDETTVAAADGGPSAGNDIAAQAPLEDTLGSSHENRVPHTQGRDSSISALYDACMELPLRLASHGLIHGDFNEFNILIENVPDPSATPSKQSNGRAATMVPHMIDFPQITSLSHPDAEEYFSRDVECIKSFFEKRYHFVAEDPGPTFVDAQARLEEAIRAGDSKRLDVAIEAAGFSKKISKELEQHFDGVDREEASAGSESDPGEINEGNKQQSVDSHEKEADETDVQAEDGPIVFDAISDGGDNRESERDRLHEDQPSRLSGSSPALPLALAQNLEPFQDNAQRDFHDSEANTAVASRFSSISLNSRQTPQSKAKAAAGWSI